MAEIKKGKHCSNCERKTLHTRSTPNHLLHLFLSVFTGGLWIFVWSLISAFPSPWLCQTCGTQYSWFRDLKRKK